MSLVDHGDGMGGRKHRSGLLTEVLQAHKDLVVELRFFAGLSVEDAARCLGISRATADRYWAYARAWLYEKVSAGDNSANG